VEMADSQTLFTQMAHPYTEALFRSIPRLDTPRDEPLEAIEGMPPDVVDPQPGCRFAPRCRYARDLCRSTTPTLAALDIGHTVACHFPLVGAPDGTTTERVETVAPVALTAPTGGER
ncbi:MAG: oligopeptide/dipeptide ABC transporter ATP-binding protein, partial [Desertimonas sp.]